MPNNTPVTSVNEPSGNHRLPDDDAAATFKLPRSTLVVVLAALIGSGSTGGVLKLLDRPSTDPAEITKAVDIAVAPMRADIASLRSEISAVNAAVAGVQTTLTADAKVREQMSKELDDHEQRIRAIEHRLR